MNTTINGCIPLLLFKYFFIQPVHLPDLFLQSRHLHRYAVSLSVIQNNIDRAISKSVDLVM